MMVKPWVSVIVASHNSAGTIIECLSSLAEQSYQNVEVIFVDNQSLDNSKDLAQNYLTKSSLLFKICSEQRKGVSFARNTGLKASTGSLICFLDADDWLFPDSIERRVNALSNGDVACVYGPYLRVKNMSFDRGKLVVPPSRVSKVNKFTGNHIPNLCGMYDRTKVGLVFQKNIGHEDYQMWLEVLQRCEVAVSVSGGALAKYRVSPKSISGNKIRSAIWHFGILKMHQMSTVSRLYYFSRYVLSSLMKRI